MDIVGTRRVADITGEENILLLLAAPGDEVTCGGLIAEACARGRPPFVAILGDGAADGTALTARRRERATREACRVLGLPAERLLFLGLRDGGFPAVGDGLFQAVRAALAQLSWRHDCNVIAAIFTADAMGNRTMAWRLAGALAVQTMLPLIACAPAGFATAATRRIWRLDVSHWLHRKEAARLAHGDDVPCADNEAVEIFMAA
jgi:LmbE family N-acetylglucosaminyl deacetylase